MLFNNWNAVAHILFVGLGSYIGVVAMLRISGKRTLSKMNAFDFVITVALGSTLAGSMTNTSVSLVDALLSFALLVGLQFVVTWIAVRSQSMHNLITAAPTLLYYNGEFYEEELLKRRIPKEGIRARMRTNGLMNLASVEAIVLETDGAISIIRQSDKSEQVNADFSIQTIHNYPHNPDLQQS